MPDEDEDADTQIAIAASLLDSNPPAVGASLLDSNPPAVGDSNPPAVKGPATTPSSFPGQPQSKDKGKGQPGKSSQKKRRKQSDSGDDHEVRLMHQSHAFVFGVGLRLFVVACFGLVD